jgi:thioredoxin-related protein
MRAWRHLLWIGLVLGSLALAEEPRDPLEHFFDQTFGDFPDELARAREEGKQGVLLFFEMDECPFCHRMKQTVLNQPRVQDFYHERFLSFVVDVGGDVEVTDFNGDTMSQKDFAFRVNRVRATPVFQFYDLDGQPVARFTGATSGVEEFLWLGEYVAEGHYKEMPFTRYKRERGQSARP